MSDMFANGRIVDLILVLVAVEIVAMAVVAVRAGRRSLLPGVVANLLAGVFLLIALRCALRDADWPWIALWLLAALGAHALDTFVRWRR